MRSVIDIVDLTVEEIEALCKKAIDISEHPDKYSEACKGKKLATLFFELTMESTLSTSSGETFRDSSSMRRKSIFDLKVTPLSPSIESV